MKRKSWLSVLTAVFIAAFAFSASAQDDQLDSIKISSNSEFGFEAVISASADTQYKVATFDNPPRVMVSFPSLPASAIEEKQVINQGILKSVRAVYVEQGKLNALVFDLEKQSAASVTADPDGIKVTVMVKQVDTPKVPEVAAPAAAPVAAPKTDKADAKRAAKDKEALEEAEKIKKKKAEREARAKAKAEAKAKRDAEKEAKRKARAEAKEKKRIEREKAKAEKARLKEEKRRAREQAKKEKAEKLAAEKKAKEEADKAAAEKAAADKIAMAKMSGDEKAAKKAADEEEKRKAGEAAKERKRLEREKAKAEKARLKEEKRKAREKARADKAAQKEAEKKAAADRKAAALKAKEEAKQAPAEKKTAVKEEKKAAAPAVKAPAPVSMEDKMFAEAKEKQNKGKAVVKNTNLSFDDAIKIGLENNLKLKIALEELALAKLKADDAKRAMYPKFMLKEEEIQGETTAKFEGRHMTAEVQVPLYSGGKLTNTLKQAKINLAVALMNFRKERNEYLYGVQEAYLALATVKERHGLKKQLLADADKAMDEMEKRHKIGTLRDLELMEMQVQYLDIKMEMDAVNNDLELAQLGLVHVLGISEESEIDVQAVPEFNKVAVDFDALWKLAEMNRPDLRVNELLISFHKYGVKMAKAEGDFKVDLSGSVGMGDEFYRTESQDYENEWFAGLKASKTLGLHSLENNFVTQDKVPAAGQTTSTKYWNNTIQLTLFNNNSFTSVKEAKIKYQKAIDEFERSHNTAAADVRKAFYEYTRAIKSLESFELKIKHGEKEVQITQAQKDVNQAVIADVLKAQGALSTVQSDLAKAKENAFLSVFKLNKEIGVFGYFNPFTGKVDESRLAARSDEESAEKEIAWYKFWASKEKEAKWNSRYPEIAEANATIDKGGYEGTKWYNVGFKHDYNLTYIDEPMSDKALRKKVKKECKAVERKEKADAEKIREEKAAKAKAEQAKLDAEEKKKRDAEKEKARVEKEKAKKAEAEKRAQEKAEKKAAKEEADKIAAEKRAAEKQAKEEAKKAEAEKKAAEKKAKEDEMREKARAQAEKAKEQAEEK